MRQGDQRCFIDHYQGRSKESQQSLFILAENLIVRVIFCKVLDKLLPFHHKSETQPKNG